MATESQPRFVGIKEAAEFLGVSYSAVWESLRRGDFPVANIQIGNKWRISRSGLEALAGEPTNDDGEKARTP